VGRPSVQSFSREATDYAAEVKDKKIVLIDGNRLTRLMIDAGVGVSVRETYLVQRLHEDFFAEFEEE
jgi:restriction system protein